MSMEIGDPRRVGVDAAAASCAAEHGRGGRGPGSTPRSMRARRSWRRAEARWTRSRRRRGCWRRIPASTPGAAACSPMTAMSSSTRRSWTGATARCRRGRRAAHDARADQRGAGGDGAKPACAADAMRAPTISPARQGWSRSPIAGSSRPSGGASSTRCWRAAASVRRRHQIWDDRRGRGRCATAMSPPRPRPAG